MLPKKWLHKSMQRCWVCACESHIQRGVAWTPPFYPLHITVLFRMVFHFAVHRQTHRPSGIAIFVLHCGTPLPLQCRRQGAQHRICTPTVCALIARLLCIEVIKITLECPSVGCCSVWYRLPIHVRAAASSSSSSGRHCCGVLCAEKRLICLWK